MSNKGTTVDDGEIAKLSEIIDWWDPTGGKKILHGLNKFSFSLAQKENASKPLANLKILDVGCGPGLLSEEYASKYPNKYDIVIASEVVEHVANVELFLNSCVDTLKPGGKIFITTANRTRLSFISHFIVIFLFEEVLRIFKKGLHDIKKFVTPDVTAMLNKNEEEINKHKMLKDVVWDPHGRCVTLHSLNHRRVPYIINGLISKPEIRKSPHPLADKKILEVGCGGGILSEGLAKVGAVVTGIDPCQELVDLAKEHSNIYPKVAENKPTYLCTTIEVHAQKYRDYYDAVIASEVIMHVANKDLFLKQCIETLKPGGKIFITAPNKTITSKIEIFMLENVFKGAAKGIHDYEKFMTPHEISRILEKNNCTVNNTHGLVFYPYVEIWQWVFFQSLWFALEATKND
ncbi:unnamed protein product [Leptosia nina]|uniref:3-demethylubiquinol 3-O-methyltransferase n=1 Tax=Leptosia nina TaxID=320188 RepID=A0AAV1K395_9NEOP